MTKEEVCEIVLVISTQDEGQGDCVSKYDHMLVISYIFNCQTQSHYIINPAPFTIFFVNRPLREMFILNVFLLVPDTLEMSRIPFVW